MIPPSTQSILCIPGRSGKFPMKEVGKFKYTEYGEIQKICKEDCLIVSMKPVKASGVKGTANNRSQRRNICNTGGQNRWIFNNNCYNKVNI